MTAAGAPWTLPGKIRLPGNVWVMGLKRWHVPILPLGGQAPARTTHVAIVDAMYLLFRLWKN